MAKSPADTVLIGREERRRFFVSHDALFTCGGIFLLTGIRSSYASSNDLAILAHRVDALETCLIKSGALLPADLEHFLQSSRSLLASYPGTPTRLTAILPATAGLPQEVEQDETNGTEEAALTLEHLAFGRSRVEGSHAIPHFGARLPSSVSKPVLNNNYHLARTSMAVTHSHSAGYHGFSSGSSAQNSPMGLPESVHERRRSTLAASFTVEEKQARVDAFLEVVGPTDGFDLFYRKTDIGMTALSKILPTRERGEILVKEVSYTLDYR